MTFPMNKQVEWKASERLRVSIDGGLAQKEMIFEDKNDMPAKTI